MTTPYCDDSILESDTGPVNIEINWEPNEINLHWYNNNTLLDVDSASNTCLYDDNLTIPQTAPTRTGYTFKGWRVRPTMDFSTIPTNENGTNGWAKGVDLTNGTDVCFRSSGGISIGEISCDSNSVFIELQQNEWKSHFVHGDLYGMAVCGSNSSVSGKPGSAGNRCWCRVTGYKPVNQSVILGPLSIKWVYFHTASSYNNCRKWCVSDCARYATGSESTRNSFLAPAEN